MRRKKDDKRVLRPGNGSQNHSRGKKLSGRQFLSRGQLSNRFPKPPRNPKNRRKKTNASRKTIFLMILALVAFVIGAGIRISLSFDSGDDAPKFVNVTKEMTSNLNNTTQVSFDKEVDGVDFNENTSSQLNVNYEYSNYTYQDYSEEHSDQ